MRIWKWLHKKIRKNKRLLKDQNKNYKWKKRKSLSRLNYTKRKKVSSFIF